MPRKRHRLQCQQCGAAFWTYELHQETCSHSCAAKRRVRLKGLAGPKPGNNEHIPPPPIKLPPSRERVSTVEQQLARVRADRLARERAAGQRTYTIEDGWAQKASNYGNPGADTMGKGYR
jgi:hypothetical protein